MRPALIGLAHGSRDSRFAATVDALMIAAVTDPVPCGAAAYLELSEPDLITACRRLNRPAIVVPLLFSSAYHAGTDVPQQVAEATRMTGVPLSIAPVLGLGADVLDVVGDAARALPSNSEIVLVAVGSSNQMANDEVERFAAQLAQRRGHPVYVGFATAAPRAVDVLAHVRARTDRVAVVPLFLAPGLLLDHVLNADVALGLPTTSPLGVAMAPVVRRRWAKSS